MNNTSVCLFKGYSDTVPVLVTMDDIFRLITSDNSVRELTEKHRFYLSQEQKTAASRAKAACPCFAVAVRFEGGKQKADLCGWTGLCMVDFDHVPAGRLAGVKKAVCADRHTLMVYVTVSGKGLRIIFRITLPEEGNREAAYREAFLQGNRYYAELAGLEFDTACKNPTRLSGLASDPKAFFNPDAVPFPEAKVSAKQKTTRNFRLERALAAARADLQEEGVAYCEHHHNEYIMRMGYLLNAYGVDQEEATAWAVGKFSDYDGDVAAIFRSCYAQTDEFGSRKVSSRKAGKSHFASVEDIEAFLGAQGKFRHNVVTGKYEACVEGGSGYEELTDRYVNSLWRRMSKEGANVRMADLRTVIESEYVPPYNPFSDYFSSLPEWDGVTDYIGAVAAMVHVTQPQEEFSECFRKWLVGTVASMLSQEVVNHEILVLVGPQGSYKTTWLYRLLPEELRRYFYLKSDCSHFTKDDFFTLSEFAVVCLEEIDELSMSEMSRLKAMVTMPHINERRAYGHYKEQRPHVASFCGTTNSPQFLNDPTGSRRWLPFTVKAIDDPHHSVIDYAHVYAQAAALWKSGFRYWFDDQEIKQVNTRNSDYEVANLETDLVLCCFRVPMPGEEAVFLTTGEIYSRFTNFSRFSVSLSRLGFALKKAGFTPRCIGGKRGYCVVEYTAEQMQQNRKALAHFL